MKTETLLLLLLLLGITFIFAFFAEKKNKKNGIVYGEARRGFKIETIMQLKEQLDCGKITEEEFEERKRKIVEL